MNSQKILLAGVLMFAGILLGPETCFAQVDPSWLRSWTESYKERPEKLTSIGRIADKSESGNPLIIRGTLLKPDGTPAAGVVVLGYHRNNEGFEFGPLDRSLSTWELQGWVKSDNNGRFEFRTIRPAPDYLGREAAHLHFTLESERFGRQWAPKFFFSDDPLVSSDQRRSSKSDGDFGSVRTVKTVNQIQHIDLKIRLKDKADF